MADQQSTRRIRIFISSPGDVKEERDALEELIKEDLQHKLDHHDDLFLQPVRWETFGRPALGDIQANLFEQLGDYDIFVGIFWNRFGTPTDDYDSGSEAEFYDAYSRWLEDTSRPVLMYFCERPNQVDLNSIDPEKALAMLQQRQKVKQFRVRISDKGLHWPYKEVSEFTKLASNHLHAAIVDYVKRSPDAPIKPQQSPDKPSLADRRRYLLALQRDCLRIPLNVLGQGLETDKKDVSLDQVFIDLNVHRRDHEALRQMETGESAESEPLKAVEAIQKSSHAVLLGDPGSGKSSFVKHVLADLAQSELEARETLLPDTRGLLPVLIVLRDFAPQLTRANLPKQNSPKWREALSNLVVEQAMQTAHTLQVGTFDKGIRQAFLDEKVFLVFDGLDEVPLDVRALVRDAVGAVLNQYRLKRVLVTCRIRSYSGDAIFDKVETFTLADLNEEQIKQFIGDWYAAQGELNRIAAADVVPRTQDLLKAAVNEPLRSLAENPMLLTTMTIIHQQEAELPRERVRLYNLAVDLLLKRWQRGKTEMPRELAAFFESPEERVRPVMERLAFEAHQAGAGDKAADLPRSTIIELLSDEAYLGYEGLAAEFLKYVDLRAGLLIGRGGTEKRPAVYSFPHRTFQEYLAGSYIAGERGAHQRLKELAAEGEFWSDAALLGFEELLFNRRNANQLLNLASQLSRCSPADEAQSRQILWAGRIARVVGVDQVERDPGDLESGHDLIERLRSQLVGVLGGPLPPPERVQAGRVLARLGDPRKALLTIEDLSLCLVPQGPFLMGDELKKTDLSYDFWIGQYPVTQAQYRFFADDDGYDEERWWTKSGWQQKTSSKWTDRRVFGDSYELANHPVVGVSWYEALAFTRWLTKKGHDEGWLDKKLKIALPSEHEWEKAARGGLDIPVNGEIQALSVLSGDQAIPTKPNPLPGRRYPWGDDIDANKANYDSMIESTSTPGAFSEGLNPYGLYDLSGNVWEWNRSQPTGKGDEEGSNNRVLRGGSFIYTGNSVRCAARDRSSIRTTATYDWGFRIVVLPFKTR